MIDVMKHLGDVGADTARLRGLLQEALQEEQDPGTREFLQLVHEALGTSFNDVKEVLPAAQAEMNRELAELQQTHQQLQAELDELQAQLDKARAAAAAPPPPPPAPPAYDPRLGKQLRDELVGRYGPKRPAGAAAAHGDVADVASSEFKTIEQPPPQAAPAPPPSPSKAPKTPPSPSKAPRTSPKPKPKQPGDDGGEWTRDA